MNTPPSGFDQIFAAHSDGVFRFCLRLTGCRTEAEDLTQETFVCVYQRLGSFRGESSLPTWIYRIAFNRASKHLRRRALARLFVPRAPQSPDVTEDLALWDAVLRLPLPERSAFLLVKLEGLSCEEAAVSLAVPIGTVKSRVHRAVKALRNRLGEPTTNPEETAHVV